MNNASIILANDPDADRFAVAEKVKYIQFKIEGNGKFIMEIKSVSCWQGFIKLK